MIKNIEISVIVPVYNVEAYLPELISALQNQSLTTFEVIFVNDGSTDSSESIIAEAARYDPRLKLVNQTNSGVSSARNTGITHAVGTWVYFIDSDDWVAPNTLQTWLSEALKQEVELLIGNGFRFTTHPETQPRLPLLKKQPWGQVLEGKQWIIHSVAQKEWPHIVWLQFIKREVIINHGLRFVEGIVHEDILWTTDVALHVAKIGFCPEPLYGYRINHNSITGSSSPESLYKRAHSYIKIIQTLSGTVSNSHDAALNKALLLQINRESGHFLSLLRKKITAPQLKRDLAKAFIALRTPSLLRKAKVNPKPFWLTFRCYAICLFYALRG